MFKMNLVDTHCHLYLEDFDLDRNELIQSALDSGITALLLPNIDKDSVMSLHSLCEQYPTFCYPMMGMHPTSVTNDYASDLSYLETLLNKRSYCGIGEIGIDLYWDTTYLKEQKLVFEEQLKWSIDLSLPVSIHTRNAFSEVFDSIHKIGAEKLKGVFHSFTGTEEDLREILALKNFKLGLNGIITYKNSDVPNVLKNKSVINDIVLETDAPFLPPVPYRGKRNVPVYLHETMKKVAEVYNITIDEVALITGKNARELFVF